MSDFYCKDCEYFKLTGKDSFGKPCEYGGWCNSPSPFYQGGHYAQEGGLACDLFCGSDDGLVDKGGLPYGSV
jgi:hypothetical protein